MVAQPRSGFLDASSLTIARSSLLEMTDLLLCSKAIAQAAQLRPGSGSSPRMIGYVLFDAGEFAGSVPLGRQPKFFDPLLNIRAIQRVTLFLQDYRRIFKLAMSLAPFRPFQFS